MKQIILYDSDDYSPILNEELANEIKKQHLEDFGEEATESYIESEMESQGQFLYDELLETINQAMSDRFLVKEVGAHHSIPPFTINEYSNFTDEIQSFIDACHPSSVNGIRIGVNEDGNLFFTIHSGNASYPNYYEVKNLSQFAQNIIDNYESSFDVFGENDDWFDNLSDNEFGEQDLYKAFWDNPKFAQQIRLKNCNYDEIKPHNIDYFQAQANRIKNLENEDKLEISKRKMR